MCKICGYTDCHPHCPNYECNKVNTCDKCGGDIYKEYTYWIDNDENIFCSEDCANDYYGIKEMDY